MVTFKNRQGQTRQNTKEKLRQGWRGIVGTKQGDLDTLLQINVRNHKKHPTHQLHKEYGCRQIERSGKYKTLKTKIARRSKSFLPKSITLLSDNDCKRKRMDETSVRPTQH